MVADATHAGLEQRGSREDEKSNAACATDHL